MSTPVPSMRVDQFWLPAMTWPRVFAPGETYWTPGRSRMASASSTVSVFEDPCPWRTPPTDQLPELTMIMFVPADLT